MQNAQYYNFALTNVTSTEAERSRRSRTIKLNVTAITH